MQSSKSKYLPDNLPEPVSQCSSMFFLFFLIKSLIYFFFTVRKWRAFGRAPCAYYSALRNTASPTEKKKLSPRHVTQPRDGPPLPMVLMFLPLLPGGLRGGRQRARSESARRRRQKTGAGVTRQKQRDICFSSPRENSPDPGD